jgi:hypothetical protein
VTGVGQSLAKRQRLDEEQKKNDQQGNLPYHVLLSHADVALPTTVTWFPSAIPCDVTKNPATI